MQGSGSTQRTALVTGANKGIGLEVARQLGLTGMTVLVGSRDPGRGRAAVDGLASAGIDAHAVTLDVTDDGSIAAAAIRISHRFVRLDVLVNNAGIAAQEPPSGAADPDVLRRVFDTNFFGAVAVTRAMLPLLRLSAAGRIVNVSSGLASLAQNADPAYEFAAVKQLGYSASKAALNMFTVHLAHELRDTLIKVNAADPGFTATDLNAHRGYRTAEQGAAGIVRLATLGDDGPTGGFFDERGAVPW